MVNKVTKKKHYRPPGKKKEGNTARYVTRSHALKHLQLSLPLFRKLCIFKGIFPREPKKKVKGNHHTYYHVKDVAFLHHEPLLEKFREIIAYDRKIHRADAKKNKERANFLKEHRPTDDLERMQILKERYPKFMDALRDLDDCLSTVHLFATLPTQGRVKVEAARIHNCQRLSCEWQAFISRTHKLRKVFISVKGIYYQAEVEGQKITWLAPHSFRQVIDDDLTVILNFVDSYETLLGSVNNHLYKSINLKYPPILDPHLDALAADLYALYTYFDASARSSHLGPLTSSSLRSCQVDDEDDEDNDTRECKELFKNMKFFLSREVSRESLLFVIPAFGGTVSWEGNEAPFKESEETITHQIVDKPTLTHKFLSRDYVQPQWVFDCVNTRIILPTDAYLVGRNPPPHLSPFVDNEAEEYIPDYAKTVLTVASKIKVLPLPGVGKENLDDPQNLLVEGVIDRSEAIIAFEEKQKMLSLEEQYHDELKMELQGTQYPLDISKIDDDSDLHLPDYQQIAKDNDELSMVMMSRKKRRLYQAMKISERRNKDHNKLLEDRKRKLQESHKS